MQKTSVHGAAAFKNQALFHTLLMLVLLLVYGFLFIGFYYLYVPLGTSFQAILVPLLVLTAVVTLINREWGLLLFIFCVPLINCLPYFFGIGMRVSHAPTALVLFLVFSPAWFLSGFRTAGGLRWERDVARPLFLLILVAGISAAITAWRFSNFYPILSSHFRDLIVNANAVRAGGAIMSTVMSFLNYATGFIFFGIVVATVRSRDLIRKILLTLCASASLAFGFALVQAFYAIDLGNTALFINLGRINATFKDPNSFGWFISLYLPLCLGLVLASKGKLRIFLIFSYVPALVVLPFVGSRSGLLALLVGLGTFLLLIEMWLRWPFIKKMALLAGSVVSAAVIFMLLWNVSGRAVLKQRVEENVQAVAQRELSQVLNPGRVELWKAAATIILDYPLTGVGTGAYIVEYPNYRERGGDPSAHTDSLGVLRSNICSGFLWPWWRCFPEMHFLPRESFPYLVGCA
jgi:O-antigen ligase